MMSREEFGDVRFVEALWWARISNREYAAAKELLNTMPERVEAPRWSALGIPVRLLQELLASWFLEEHERVEELLREVRASVNDWATEGDLLQRRAVLGMALLTALEGDTKETERLIRRWNREGASDWPDRTFYRDLTCQILGMAGAAEAAVTCLRTGLSEPSRVMPFLEPYLPYYDSIRDEAVFVELLAELGDAPQR